MSDRSEEITDIQWSIYGKILKIYKNDELYCTYTYDASGNRISKHINETDRTTWYVRDAQGNVLSIYEYKNDDYNEGRLTQREVHLYGSSRLGMQIPDIDVEDPVSPSTDNLPHMEDGYYALFERGRKYYELSNHLGNVLATVSDKKIGKDDDSDGIIDFYTADVVNATDYYPGGMIMPGRKYSTSSYRYGFNGKENDNEVKGESNQQDYGFRIYDPRVGRFLSVDPLTSSFPELTPYQYASNTPIQSIDLDGLESLHYTRGALMRRFESQIAVDNAHRLQRDFGTTVSAAKPSNPPLHIKIHRYFSTPTPAKVLSNPTFVVGWALDGLANDAKIVGSAFVNGGRNATDIEGHRTTEKQRLFAFTNVATTVGGPLIAAEIKATNILSARLNAAENFYAKSGFAQEQALNHMEGINFDKAVQTITLKKGTVVQQWVGENGVGNYFTTLENGSAKNLGIGNYDQRVLKQFTLTDDVQVLKSTAADYKGNAGGGTQLFSTELKSKIVETPK